MKIPEVLLCDVEFVVRPWPENIKKEEARLFAHERTHLNGPVYARCLRDSVVWAQPLIEYRGRAVWWPDRFGGKFNMDQKFELRRAIGKWRQKMAPFDRAYMFFDQYSNHSVYHWLFDALPRFLLLRSLHGNTVTAILPECASWIADYQERSLQWIGFQGKIHRLPYKHGLRVPELLTCDLVTATGHHRPKIIKFMQTIIRTRFGADENRGEDLVYISREKAGSRRSTNEREVRQTLESLGFKTVFLEDMTPEEQVESTLFAKVIVGNHGGGLPAMLYAPPGCKIVEIRSNHDDRNNCYYTLATALGLPYYYHLATPTQPERGLFSDFKVDCKSLENLIRRIL